MQRFNLFTLTNKGLRNDMYLLSIRLQHAAPSGTAAAAVARALSVFLRQWQDLSRQTTLRVSACTTPGASGPAGIGPQTGIRLAGELQACIDRWQHAARPKEQLVNRDKLIYDFNEFLAFNLYDMNYQEQELMPVLTARCTDDDIRQMHAAVLQALSRTDLLAHIQRMILAGNTAELLQWHALLQQFLARGTVSTIYRTIRRKAAGHPKLSHFFNTLPDTPITFAS